MKEEIIFHLPGISLSEIHDNNVAPLAFNDVQPLNIVDETSSKETCKERQNYIIQCDQVLIEKNVKDIMIQYQYCDKTHEWPNATHYHCFWCCHQFDTIPCFIPIALTKNVYKVYGNFCSFNCALSFNFYSNNVNYCERNLLIQDLYYKLYGYDAPQLKFAPAKEVLEMFGGAVNIEDYRKTFTTINNYKLTFPNILFIIPQLMEEKQMNNYQKPIELPKSINNPKPITNVNTVNSLITSMGIQKVSK
jgi:hypothetical protein